jgi:hypothetical protein
LPLQASVRRTPVLRRYFTGTNMFAEAWTLKVTEWTGDGKRFRYRVSGSVTGPDGEGESGQDFVSRSGRIRIYADDFTSQAAPPVAEQGPDPQALRPAPDDLEWTWRIVSKSCDGIRSMPYNSHDKRHPQINEPLVNRELAPPDNSRANPSYTWVTVADGLPFGRHELTLITTGNAPIGIVGMEVSRPPLAGEP